MVNRKIRIVKQLEVTDLAGEKVMIDFETGKYFMIKGAGNDIWDIMQEETDIEKIVDKLLEIYEIDRDTCQKSVEDFFKQLEKNHFIEMVE